MKEALFYKKLNNNIVQCELCPHFCVIKPNERGKCGARENQSGKLMSLVYARPCSMSLDPIEKKPLYNFHPGNKTFSLATVGCNLACKHCQNWEISQAEIEKIPHRKLPPEDVIILTKKSKSKIISFTYTEPTIFYEYMLDIAKLAKKENLLTAMITNGFINPAPLKKILPYIDAFNVDLKSMNNDFYGKICGAKLSPILETIKTIHKAGKHLELTNLLIPRYNDSDEDIKKLVQWILDNLSSDVPLHFSAFYPCYQLINVAATNPEKVKSAAEIAKKRGLKNVHTGNI